MNADETNEQGTLLSLRDAAAALGLRPVTVTQYISGPLTLSYADHYLFIRSPLGPRTSIPPRPSALHKGMG